MALTVLVLVMVVATVLVVRSKITPELRARNRVETVVEWLLIGCSTIAVFTTIGIVASVAFEAFRFFSMISPIDFLFGTTWSPQMAIREDQVGSSGSFGAVPLFAGTLLDLADRDGDRRPDRPLLGHLPRGVRAPAVPHRTRSRCSKCSPACRPSSTDSLPHSRSAPRCAAGAKAIGLDVASESALAAGLVMGIMIIPFVSSLADDMISAVPQSLRDGAYALGATRSETIKQVVMRAALPGIVGGVLLAVSRAIGETMIVVMAAGLAANLTANPLEAVTTVTVQIVTLLVGDQEFDSPKTLAAFALGPRAVPRHAGAQRRSRCTSSGNTVNSTNKPRKTPQETQAIVERSIGASATGPRSASASTASWPSLLR